MMDDFFLAGLLAFYAGGILAAVAATVYLISFFPLVCGVITWIFIILFVASYIVVKLDLFD